MPADRPFRLTNTDSDRKECHLVAKTFDGAFDAWCESFALLAPGRPELKKYRLSANYIAEVDDAVLEIVDLNGGGLRSTGDTDFVLRGGHMNGNDAQGQTDTNHTPRL
jgi:hypothetical protein